jgi:hypothetical protein
MRDCEASDFSPSSTLAPIVVASRARICKCAEAIGRGQLGVRACSAELDRAAGRRESLQEAPRSVKAWEEGSSSRADLWLGGKWKEPSSPCRPSASVPPMIAAAHRQGSGLLANTQPIRLEIDVIAAGHAWRRAVIPDCPTAADLFPLAEALCSCETRTTEPDGRGQTTEPTKVAPVHRPSFPALPSPARVQLHP